MNIFGSLTAEYNSSFISLVKIVWSVLRIMLDILNSYPLILTMEQCKNRPLNSVESRVICFDDLY